VHEQILAPIIGAVIPLSPTEMESLLIFIAPHGVDIDGVIVHLRLQLRLPASVHRGEYVFQPVLSLRSDP
jgi:hypothetical protein